MTLDFDAQIKALSREADFTVPSAEAGRLVVDEKFAKRMLEQVLPASQPAAPKEQ